MRRLTLTWHQLRASFWFVPAIVVSCSMAAAVALVELDGWQGADLAAWSPRLFGAGAEGSRAMLSAIATSMITVAGVVFSITIVALSLTSTQYSPRVLRNFMRDGPTQVVLGVFLGIFAYCLVVLRTIRGAGELTFIPSLAVLAGLAYALAGVVLLIFFIHHVSQSIQAASIIGRIALDTTTAIDHLFPEDLGQPMSIRESVGKVMGRQVPVLAKATGYVTSVDGERLMDIARSLDREIRLRVGVGDFIAEGSVLLELPGATLVEDDVRERLIGTVLLGPQRTVEQDAAFGLQQLVDVALKALSPGINDPTTACMAIDQIGALLGRLAARHIPVPYRRDGGRLRLIVPAPGFRELVQSTLLPILEHGRGDSQVLQRLVAALSMLGERTCAEDRREVLRTFARALHAELRHVKPTSRRAEVSRGLRRVDLELGRPSAGTRAGLE